MNLEIPEGATLNIFKATKTGDSSETCDTEVEEANCALTVNGGTLTVNGGTLTVNGGTLTVNGGTLTVNGGSITGGANVTLGADTVTINGGTIDVATIGKDDNAEITLGYGADANTSIKATEYKGTVSVADAQAFYYEDSGTKKLVTGENVSNISDIGAKELNPVTATLRIDSLIVEDGGSLTFKVNSDETETQQDNVISDILAGAEVEITVTSPAGYTVTSTLAKTQDNTNGITAGGDYTFTLPNGTQDEGEVTVYTFSMPYVDATFSQTVTIESFQYSKLTVTGDSATFEATNIGTDNVDVLKSGAGAKLTGGMTYIVVGNVALNAAMTLEAGETDAKEVTLILRNGSSLTFAKAEGEGATGEETEVGKITIDDGLTLNIYREVAPAEGEGDPGEITVDTIDGAGTLGIYGGTITATTISTTNVTVYGATVNNVTYNNAGTSYTATFDPNYNDATKTTQSLKYGETNFTKPADPTRDGYTFKGWFAVDGENTDIADGATVYDFTANATEDIYLKAGWEEAATYAITYKGLEGAEYAEDESNPATYTASDTVTAIELKNPTRTGWTFVKWECTEVKLTEADGIYSIPANTTGNLTITAHWTHNAFTPTGGEGEGATPEFAYHSLILSGKIGVIFYVYLPEGIKSEDCSMAFTIGSSGVGTLDVVEATHEKKVGNNTFYGFECPITSIQMADEITATLTYATGKTLENKYSAKTYLDYALTNDGEDFKDLEPLIGAIKNYGHYAQEALRDNWKNASGNPAPKKYTAMDEYDEIIEGEISGLIAEGAENEVKNAPDAKSSSEAVISSVGLTLDLDSDTSLIVNLTPDDDYTLATPTVTGWSNVTVEGNTITFKGIPAHKLAEKFTITVTATPTEGDASGNVGADGPIEIEVSALSYVRRVLERNDGTATLELKQAVTALYRYYDATVAYRETLDQGNGSDGNDSQNQDDEDYNDGE